MSDLAKIREELFWVFLEEEVRNFGVLKTPCPTAVGHNGECGGDVAAARNYLGLRQRLLSPHRWLICRTSVSYVFSWKTEKDNSAYLHTSSFYCVTFNLLSNEEQMCFGVVSDMIMETFWSLQLTLVTINHPYEVSGSESIPHTLSWGLLKFARDG